ncbi:MULTISPECIES: hypothetical protein [unclassified Oleiphilus]|jgi:hypothetical protein|uniref:hypothetical protein n=1 Tax=unclassified Oleiphilus TaxID=2631174 RepID=UPI0007C35EDD|nr:MULTISPECIES: hypothetical protein [unclassified Oleiphilus]KZY43301.1 hypothetical protein A3732_14600 [Oleiphilus sp. HI0050]KZY77139.1 hypothetical protein A3740_11045 [Oleiphilus sp. HI0068]KZY85968.1 hypothetical protein A3741_14705 [Oleiphilus sp. HI0069]KZY89858.1 hypothetical protein A3743_07835 [Oleiphilus sp. HI0072]KZZ20149.1 hypothetical protein A3752_12545 [Oleiphilus sp. HI0081]
MKILKEGDVGKVLCHTCESVQNSTFKLRDVPFSDDSGSVKNILAGVCDACDSVAAIPHQSTPAIKKQLDKQRKSVEGRVPSHLVDVLNLASDSLGASADFIPSLIKYYIHAFYENSIAPKDLLPLLKSDLAKGRANKRISLKGRYVAEEIEVLKARAQIETTTELLKSIVLKIHEEILVKQKASRIKELERLVAAVA